MLPIVKVWTLDERRELRRRFPGTADSELAVLFGTSEDDVRAEAARLALGKDKDFFKSPMPRWTPVQIERLRALYPDHATLEIARLLGRTKESVFWKARELGLRKTELRVSMVGHENVRLRRRWPVPRNTG